MYCAHMLSQRCPAPDRTATGTMSDKPTKIVFSDKALKALPRATERYVVWAEGEPGFGIRVSPSGVKTFVLSRRPLGSKNTTTATVARFNGRNLTAARVEATKIGDLFKAGENPAEARRRASKDSFEAMCLAYIETLRDKRQGGQVEGYVRREWLGQVPTTTRVQVSKVPARWEWQTTWANGPRPYLRNRPAKFVTRAEIVARLDAIKTEPRYTKGGPGKKKGKRAEVRGPWASRHALDAIRRVFAWAAAGHRHGVEVSPAAGLSHDVVGLSAKQMKRRRALDDAELRRVWEAAGKLGPFGVGVRLLMLTAGRRDDVFAARWEDVRDLDGEQPMIVVPPERYKTDIDEPFEIMLGPKAVELVESLPRYVNCEFVFSNDGRRMLSSFSKGKARLDEISGVTGWVMHDLRRVVRSRLRQLGERPDVCEQVLGHVLPGISGVYDVGSYRREKQAALLKWERALLAIVEPRQQRARAA